MEIPYEHRIKSLCSSIFKHKDLDGRQYYTDLQAVAMSRISTSLLQKLEIDRNYDNYVIQQLSQKKLPVSKLRYCIIIAMFGNKAP